MSSFLAIRSSDKLTTCINATIRFAGFLPISHGEAVNSPNEENVRDRQYAPFARRLQAPQERTHLRSDAGETRAKEKIIP